MMVVIAYDVDTTSAAGAKRLRKVARLCEQYGIRVQNSVFEVLVDAAQLAALKAKLEKTFHPEVDSIRIYRLGNSYQNKIDVMGKCAPVEAGAKRLRKVARLCEQYGIRVQNSVFEVLVDAAQLAALKAKLEKTFHPEVDSIRIYRLGNSYQNKIDVMGKCAPVEAGEALLF